MKKILAAPKIDFADSSFKSLEIVDKLTLFIYILSWKETIITMKFQEPIHLSYFIGSHISNFYEISENSNLLAECSSRYYLNKQTNHSFKLFQIEDLYEFPIIKIIATSVEVNHSENYYKSR